MLALHVEDNEAVPAVFEIVADAGRGDIEEMLFVCIRSVTAEGAEQSTDSDEGDSGVHGKFRKKLLVKRAGVKETSFMNSNFFRLAVLALLALWSATLARAADPNPVFLYSRNFNAAGEARYLPDGNFKELLRRLSQDFDVRANDKPLTAETLTGVKVVLIANPSDKAVEGHPAPHHFEARDVAALTKFVNGGGALIVLGNQENHNLETEDTNQLLRQFGLRFTNLYTDAKLLPLPMTTPIIGGLKWGYYTGNQVLIEAKHAAKPRALVMNDLSIKPAKGDRDTPGALLGIAEPGKGRVIVVTDAGWLADFSFDDTGVGGVSLKGQENWEIFHHLAQWAAQVK